MIPNLYGKVWLADLAIQYPMHRVGAVWDYLPTAAVVNTLSNGSLLSAYNADFAMLIGRTHKIPTFRNKAAITARRPNAIDHVVSDACMCCML